MRQRRGYTSRLDAVADVWRAICDRQTRVPMTRERQTGDALDGRELQRRSPRSLQLQQHGPLARGDVLGDLARDHAFEPVCGERLLQPIDRGNRLRQQVMGRPRIAQLVSTFPEKPEPAVARME